MTSGGKQTADLAAACVKRVMLQAVITPDKLLMA